MIFNMRSTDTGAPVLSGQVGALTTLWDALFVAGGGYNSQSGVTATQAAGVATFTKTAHGYRTGQVLTITGFTTTDYNLTGVVLSTPLTSTWTMAIGGSAASPAVGTGTTIVAPLGWSIDKTGSSLRNYKMAAGNQRILGIDDTNANNARVRGFSASPSTAGVGTTGASDSFPTDAVLSGGGYCWKSSTADATARAWTLWSNGTIVFFVKIANAAGSGMNMFIFGDITSYYSSADAYATLLVCEGAASLSGGAQPGSAIVSAMNGGTTAGTHTLCRSYTQTGGAKPANKYTDTIRSNAATQAGTNGMVYPAPIEGGLILAPLWIGEVSTDGPRGHVPGLWVPCHITPWANGDTGSGAVGTPLAGKTFEAVSLGGTAQLFVETSDTWV